MHPRFPFAQSATLALILCLATRLIAAEGDKPAPTDSPKPSASALQKQGRGIFNLKDVTLDNIKGAVSFPAVVNMNSNVVEYVVVCDDGKTHESLLRTIVEPRDIHVAMLLIGAKCAPPLSPDELHRVTRFKGDKVQVWVEWKDEKTSHKVRAEDLLRNNETGKTMQHNHWIYNGSWTFKKTFIAEVERSILAIFTDKDALMNCADPQSANDEIWFAHTKKIPKEGAPVRVTFQLLPTEKQAKAK